MPKTAISIRAWLPLLMLVAAACDRADPDTPVRVSVIGAPPTLIDPNRKVPSEAQRVLIGAVGEGLVTYDEAGQIAPGLAQRWIVTSDGLSAIFRLRRVTWPGGQAVQSGEVARRLRALLAPGSRNPLRTAFDSIEEISATTPEVIEVLLTTPRPPLMELLAQPEAAMFSRKLDSTGPFKITGRDGDTVRLAPRVEVAEGGEGTRQSVALTGERAARAVARFADGGADLVLGGTYLDWPVLGVADLPNRAIRIDPAEGLFGLAVQRADGFLADPVNRQVLGMAIDREALLAAFGARGWAGELRVLPRRYRSAAEPAFPSWAGLDLAGRVVEARRRVAAWRAGNAAAPQIRVYLPDGPGSILLFARLAADWRRVGIDAVRSDAREADVRLLDQVAPAGSALWYLNQVACPAPATCADDARDALAAARAADSLFERGNQLAAADRIIAESGLYVPLARPLRWSLVAPRLNLFRDNARAWHPLSRLIRPRN